MAESGRRDACAPGSHPSLIFMPLHFQGCVIADLYHGSSVTADAGVIDNLAAERSPPVVATPAAFITPPAMFSESRQTILEPPLRQ